MVSEAGGSLATPKKECLPPVRLEAQAAFLSGESQNRAVRLGVPGGRAGTLVRSSRVPGRVPERQRRGRSDQPLQSGGLGRLGDCRGPRMQADYDTAARTQIFATAQRPPHLGATTIRRVLGAAGSSYQKAPNWYPTSTAQRVRKTEWCRLSIRRPRKQGADRHSVSLGRRYWLSPPVLGRGKPLPSIP